MFGGPTALWISPSANNLAFVRFDDAKVENFQYPIYGEPRSNTTIYPEYRSIRYPKVWNNELDDDLMDLRDYYRIKFSI